MRAASLLFCPALAACAAPQGTARPSAPADDRRTVPACIVNDAEAPADEAVIARALDIVFFVPDARVSVPFAPSGWPMDMAFALRKACLETSEARFVFTDRFVALKEVSMTAARRPATPIRTSVSSSSSKSAGGLAPDRFLRVPTHVGIFLDERAPAGGAKATLPSCRSEVWPG